MRFSFVEAEQRESKRSRGNLRHVDNKIGFHFSKSKSQKHQPLCLLAPTPAIQCHSVFLFMQVPYNQLLPVLVCTRMEWTCGVQWVDFDPNLALAPPPMFTAEKMENVYHCAVSAHNRTFATSAHTWRVLTTILSPYFFCCPSNQPGE